MKFKDWENIFDDPSFWADLSPIQKKGIKKFIKEFGNTLLDELKMEEEKISKKDWTLQNLLTSVQTKKQINLKIKSLRELLK